MKLYSTFIKKNSSGEIEDVVLLKEGFSWRAFFFTPLWFLYHKMWCEFLVFISINFAFSLLTNIISDFDIILLEISFLFIVALNANYWLAEHLKKKSYEFVGINFGNNCVAARLNFAENFSEENFEVFAK